MKFKPFAILVIVAIVLGTAAVLMSRNETRRMTPSSIGTKVLPALETSINDVATILVHSPTATARVARIDGTWKVPGKFAYPVDFSKLRDLLTRLGDLKALQALRSSPTLLADLQLEAAGKPESAATLIELQDAKGGTVAKLRLGKPRLRSSTAGADTGPAGGFPDGRFVATDQAHVYLVGDALTDLPATDKDWLDTEFLNVNASDVTSVEVTGVTSGVARVERSRTGDLTLKDLPKGKEADTTKLTALTAALSFLRFDDLADPTLTSGQTGLDKPVVFKGKTTQGEVYTVHVGKSPAGDSRRYVSATVAFEEPPAPPAGTNAAEVAAFKAKAEEQKKTEAAVKHLNAKLGPWIYLINSYQAEALTKGQADLFTVQPDETKASSTPEAP